MTRRGRYFEEGILEGCNCFIGKAMSSNSLEGHAAIMYLDNLLVQLIAGVARNVLSHSLEL
jgi:hypothetical protein